MTPPPDGSASAPSLTEQASRGVIWGVGGALTYQLYGLVVQTALTYLLSKSQFGAYGKAYALVSFSMLLQQIGFNEVLLRRGRRLRLWSTQVTWFALSLGALGALLLVAVAYPAARIYDDPRLIDLILLTAPMPLIRSLTVAPVLQLVQNMRFRLYYSMVTLTALGTLSLTWVLALLGFGERSFVVATLFAETGYVIVLWRSTHTRIDARPRMASWIALAGKLKFVLGANLARWARMSIDPLILGLFASPSAVGVYFFAQSMVGQIVRVVTLNLSGVLLPALNKIENDPVRQTDAFLRACHVLAIVSVPMCVGLGAIAELFVRVFLDRQKWQALPPVIAALALGTAFRLLDEPTQALLSAQGRFRLGFWISATTAMVYMLACTLGSLRGDPFDTALAVSTYGVVTGPVVLAIVLRGGARGLDDALRVFLVPMGLSVVAIAPWVLLGHLWPAAGRVRDGGMLVAEVIGSGGSYLLICRHFEPAGWQELVTRLRMILPLPIGLLTREAQTAPHGN
ncbi:MAG: oligosaccharide flippase family protein [Steroidobacteraceae bacterium]